MIPSILSDSSGEYLARIKAILRKIEKEQDDYARDFIALEDLSPAYESYGDFLLLSGKKAEAAEQYLNAIDASIPNGDSMLPYCTEDIYDAPGAYDRYAPRRKPVVHITSPFGDRFYEMYIKCKRLLRDDKALADVISLEKRYAFYYNAHACDINFG